jgi:hypothetical protein
MYTLYLKTHNITGLKYLGYTKNPNPIKYRGSGLYWKYHIKKYGNDVFTEILFQSSSIEEISIIGREFSEKWNVAENEEFANFCNEDGNMLYGKANPNFVGHPHTEETRKKISQNNARSLKGKTGKDHPAFRHKVHPDNKNHLIKARANKGEPWNKGLVGVQPMLSSTKKKIGNSNRGKKKPVVICPHCNKSGGISIMMRYHFERCKLICV